MIGFIIIEKLKLSFERRLGMFADVVMSINYQSISIESDLWEMISKIVEYKLRGISVVDSENNLMGYISIDDLLHRREMDTLSYYTNWINIFITVKKSADIYIKEHALQVSELVSRSNIGIEKSQDIRKIIEIMSREKIDELPVIENGKLIGIVSKLNILSYLLSNFQKTRHVIRSDDEIYRDIEFEFYNQKWSQGIKFDVHDGTVTLSGSVFNSDSRIAARVAVENIVGMKRIIDNLVIINLEIPL